MATRTQRPETDEPREEQSDGVKCDNHPDRDAKTFTQDGAIEVNLCEECTPPWFKDE